MVACSSQCSGIILDPCQAWNDLRKVCGGALFFLMSYLAGMPWEGPGTFNWGPGLELSKYSPPPPSPPPVYICQQISCINLPVSHVHIVQNGFFPFLLSEYLLWDCQFYFVSVVLCGLHITGRTGLHTIKSNTFWLSPALAMGLRYSSAFLSYQRA